MSDPIKQAERRVMDAKVALNAADKAASAAATRVSLAIDELWEAMDQLDRAREGIQ